MLYAHRYLDWGNSRTKTLLVFSVETCGELPEPRLEAT